MNGLKLAYQESARHFTINDAIAIYGISSKFNIPSLKEDVSKFISENTQACLESEAFLCQDYNVIEELTKADDLNVLESIILQRVLDWSSFQCQQENVETNPENLRKSLAKILYNIRFLSIPEEMLASNTLLRNILSEEEMSEIQSLYSCSVHVDPVSQLFRTDPRKGHLCEKILRFPKVHLSYTRYADISKHAISFEVSGPLWLHGVALFRGYIKEQSIAISLQVEVNDKIIRSVETVTQYKNNDDTIDVYFQRALRVRKDSKYTLLLDLFGSASDRDIHYSTGGTSIVEFCGEKITFTNSPKSTTLTCVTEGQFAALILEGMKSGLP